MKFDGKNKLLKINLLRLYISTLRTLPMQWTKMNLNHLSTEQLHDLMLMAANEGGIPAPDGYAEDGCPRWSIEALAAFFGKTPEQINKAINDAFASLADVAWAGPAR